MSERKLASVRRIAAIDPIEGADNIVCATVDGWKLVTQKSNNFQPGDLVVYFEIDSFLPICEKFEFLRKSSYKKMGEEEGFRLRTIKLRGQVSQGLILPLTEIFKPEDATKMYEGLDLTETLGIKKWDPPMPAALAGKAKGNFPSWINKTDQERVQNIMKYLPPFKQRMYEVTLKLDGSSMTVYKKDGYVGVCSRNLDLEETADNAFWRVARETKLIETLEAIPFDNFAIQGELMGPGIQGNRENFNTLRFFVFDVFDINAQFYLDYEARHFMVRVLLENGAKIDHTQIVMLTDLTFFNTVDDYLKFAECKSINHDVAEGVVFKNIDGPRHSFKVISNKFLLKEKD